MKTRTSSYKRLYGKNLKELGILLGISMCAVIYRHRAGMLKYLEITSNPDDFKPLDKRVNITYSNVKSRCENPNDVKYHCYGGRGIKNYITLQGMLYLWNRDNASKLKQPSIDRIDPEGNYSIENCRFIEMSENRMRRDK